MAKKSDNNDKGDTAMVVDGDDGETATSDTTSIKQSTISITSNKSQDPRNKWVHSFDDVQKRYIHRWSPCGQGSKTGTKFIVGKCIL